MSRGEFQMRVFFSSIPAHSSLLYSNLLLSFGCELEEENLICSFLGIGQNHYEILCRFPREGGPWQKFILSSYFSGREWISLSQGCTRTVGTGYPTVVLLSGSEGRNLLADPEKEENNLPERMTTLTSFSSLEISELEVKGLILSLFQVILVADGSNYLSHFFGTISHGNLKEITSTSFHQSLIQSSSLYFSIYFWWRLGLVE